MKTAPQTEQRKSDYAVLNVQKLLAVIAEKEKHIAEQYSQSAKSLEDKDHIIQEQSAYIKLIEEKLRLATIRRFGASSEKSPFQGQLFDEVELEVSLSEIEAQEQAQQSDKTPKKKRTRQRGFAENMPRTQVHHHLSDDEKTGASKTFFSKVKEELDIIPAQVQVIEHWQEKAVFERPDGEQTLIAATRPPHPLGKCVASTRLLAYIIASKYADGLPLYRLEKILARYNGSVTRSNMANWVMCLEDSFRPLINLGRETQLASDYLQADETRVQVLKETGKAATSDSWMWVVRGGPPDKSFVLFDYDSSRSADVPKRLLDDFSGVLQTDGYAAYNRVCLDNGITHIGCWDHARRYFVDAIKAAQPPNKQGKQIKPSKADVALGKINQLYRLERQFKDMTHEKRRAARQTQSLPKLDELKTWLETTINRVPKESKTFKAIQYTLNQWHLLTGYCDDGQLHISNALAENAIRPFAVGRRAWLFSDTPKGARASAACYTLVESAKANHLEPYAYLCHVLERIGAADTAPKLEALLPWHVAEKLQKKIV